MQLIESISLLLSFEGLITTCVCRVVCMMAKFRVEELFISTENGYQTWDVYRQSKQISTYIQRRRRQKFDNRRGLCLSGWWIDYVIIIDFFYKIFIIIITYCHHFFLYRYDVFALEYQGKMYMYVSVSYVQS